MPLRDPALSLRHGGCRNIGVVCGLRDTFPGMAREFRLCERGQVLLMPPSLVEWLPEVHLGRRDGTGVGMELKGLCVEGVAIHDGPDVGAD